MPSLVLILVLPGGGVLAGFPFDLPWDLSSFVCLPAMQALRRMTVVFVPLGARLARALSSSVPSRY